MKLQNFIYIYVQRNSRNKLELHCTYIPHFFCCMTSFPLWGAFPNLALNPSRKEASREIRPCCERLELETIILI